MGAVFVRGRKVCDQPQDGKRSDLQMNEKKIGWGILGRLTDGIHLAMLRFTGRMFSMRRPASAKPVHRYGSWLQGSRSLSCVKRQKLVQLSMWHSIGGRWGATKAWSVTVYLHRRV